MGSIEPPSLKIAILINGFASPLTPSIQSSFTTAISSASASPPTIDFYDPIVAQTYPDPDSYDLIVLSGGTADPMGSQPWVLKMQDFLRTTARDFPNRKIVGICWGHQTICVSFGGTVGNRQEGAEIGVTSIQLTAEGEKMLGWEGKVDIHEYHRREVKSKPKGFVELAERGQMFINEKKTIWTFQGHPELNEGLGKALLAESPAYMGVDGREKEEISKRMERKHDGVRIWKRILEWVGE
jgi:GMP synthase-like glutamine amidotransferase